MAYDLIIGRDESDKQKYGKRGTVFLGKSYVTMGTTTSLANNIYLDVARSHVILATGKRGCVTPDTLVCTSNGFKEIKNFDIKNDLVLSFNKKTNTIEWSKAKLLKYPIQKETLSKIVLENKKTLTMTAEHPLLTASTTGTAWKKAQNLKIGDKVMCLPVFTNPQKKIIKTVPKPSKITAIKKVTGINEVYDLQVDKYPAFIVGNGIISHNSGKSYSLSVLAEEITQMPEEVKENISVLMFDTMGIFWTMKFPNMREEKLLAEWGMKPEKFDVDIYTPQGYYKEYKEKGIPTNYPFAIRTSDLKAADWAEIFEIKLTEPVGVAIEKVITSLEEKQYSIKDIINALQKEQTLDQQTKDATTNRFIAAQSWGLFDEKGITINELVKPGRVAVIDVSCYTNTTGSGSIKNLVIGYFCGKLISSRITARKAEEREAIESQGSLTRDSKKDLPMVWVMLDECLPYNSNVITNKGKIPIGKLIERIELGENIQALSHNKNTKKLEYKKITRTHKIAKRKLIELQTETGKKLKCTPDHPVLTTKGYISAISAQEIANPLEASYSKDKKLITARLLGHIVGDGYLSKNKVVGFSGKGNIQDLNKIKEDMKELGYNTSKINTRITTSKVTDTDGNIATIVGVSQEITASRKAWNYFSKFGIPIGKKTLSPKLIPPYIMKASKNEKAEFLAALMGSDGFGLSNAKNSKADFNALRISFNKLASLEKDAWKIANQIQILFNDLGISVSSITKRKGNIRKDGTKTIKIVLTISKNIENTINYIERIQFRYNTKKEKRSALLLAYFRAYKKEIERNQLLKEQTLSLKKTHKLKEVANILDVRYSQVRMWSKQKILGKFIYDFPDSEEWINTRLHDGILYEKIIEKKEKSPEDLFDITVKDNHNFIADDFIVHNCHEALPRTGSTPATNALVQLLREGRQPGISLVLATQQPGEVHTDVLTQTDIVIAHKITARRDIEALNSMMQGYLLNDISTYINNLPELKGSAIILDDNSERIYPLRVHPKKSWHGGDTPSAIKENKELFELDL